VRRRALVPVAVLVAVLAVTPPGAASAAPAPGVDVTAIDAAVRPADDFYRWANGAWLARAQIPPDRPSTGVASEITDRVEQRLRALLESAATDAPAGPARTDRQRVGAFYRAFMDEATVERLGLAPMRPELDAIARVRSLGDAAMLMGRGSGGLYGSPFRLDVDADHGDPTRYAIEVGQGDLLLPDRAFYLEPSFAAVRTRAREYAVRLLTLAGASHPEQDADAALALDARLAEASWTRVAARDYARTYHPMTRAELERVAPGFPWRTFFRAAGLGSPGRVVVAEDTAVAALARELGVASPGTLRAWLTMRTLDHAAPYLSSPFQQAFFALHQQALAGVSEPPPRWRRGIRAVSGGPYLGGEYWDRVGNLGWEVGRLYVERWFGAESRTAITVLVARLREAYRARLEAVDWWAPATRAEALRKLDGYRLKIGAPEVWRDDSGLVIRADDLVGDVRRAAAADWRARSTRRDRPVDPREWQVTPQTVVAYYGLWMQDILFAAGILEPPYFDPSADPAANYGAIGMVIAHEMTHGFDRQGRLFDADGRLRDWWTPADAEEFAARSQRLVDQFSAFEPLPGVHVNGALVVGETLADQIGLAVALDAYHRSLDGRPAPFIDGLSGDQRVFLAFAQAFRGLRRESSLRGLLLTSPYPPWPQRTNGAVRDVDGWYAAFDVHPGDALYLPPEERVRLW
jgi:putative endopeptidase